MPRFFFVTLVYQVKLNERNVASATKFFLYIFYYIFIFYNISVKVHFISINKMVFGFSPLQ